MLLHASESVHGFRSCYRDVAVLLSCGKHPPGMGDQHLSLSTRLTRIKKSKLSSHSKTEQSIDINVIIPIASTDDNASVGTREMHPPVFTMML